MAEGGVGTCGSLQEDLEADISCPLCLEAFENPRILPCGHIYCTDPCLTGLARRQNDEVTIRCPECRHVALVQAGDVNSFTRVHRLVGLVNSYNARKEIQVHVEQSPRTCAKHTKEEIVMYCDTCSQILCRDCVIDEHQGHIYGRIQKCREQYLKILEQNRKVRDKLEGTLATVEDTRRNIVQRRDLLAKQIDEEINKKAEEEKAKVHFELAVISNKKLAELQTEHDHLSHFYSEFTDNFHAAENALQNLSINEFSKIGKMISKLEHTSQKINALDLLSPTELHSDLQVHVHLQPTPIKELHLHIHERADPSKCSYTRESLNTDIQVEMPICVKISICTPEGEACLGEQSVTAEFHRLSDLSVSLPDIRCINPGLYLLGFSPMTRGRHMLAIKVNGQHILGSPTPVFVYMPPQRLGEPVAVITSLNRPGGMLAWNGKILACDHNRNRLVEIDRMHKTFTEVASIGNGPCGVTADSQLNIYVTTCLDDRLHKMDRNLTTLKVIGSHGSGNNEFDKANGVKVLNNRLFVCDSKNHRIKEYDLELNLRSIFGRKGSKLGQFQNPIDMVFDEDGTMFITDHENERIQVLSRHGMPLTEYRMTDPVTIHMQRNFLFVTQHKLNCVSVITTKGDFVTTLGKGHLFHPEEIRTDEDGFVYVTSHEDRVFVF